jgi:3',5'-cyclic AMP phosphodiesterase CpdA
LAFAACTDEGGSARTDLRFIALGDQGTGNADQKAVAVAMKERIASSGCDFIVLLGDNFYPSGVSSVSDPQWITAYEEIYGVLGLPVYAVLGNHDYGGGGGTVDAAGANEIAYVGTSGTWHMPAAWYTFDLGPARFIATDTNWITMHPTDLGQSADVAYWLASVSGWKIVFGHHPWVSNGAHGNAGTYDGHTADSAPELNGSRLATFFDTVIQEQADLYLCGHDHDLEVFASPGGKTLHVVSGGGGAGLYTLGSANTALFEKASLGFAYVIIDGSSLRLQLFDSAGALLFETSRSKP